MRRAALVAALALLPGAARTPEGEPPLRGFAPERGRWEREYERRFLALPRPEECAKLLRELTREPHVAGTPANERVADFIASEFRAAGLEVETPTYDVLLSYPQSARLEITGEPEVRLARSEEPIASDPDTAVAPTQLPWNAYAPSGDIEAEVVYVNHGSAGDYERLARMGIDVRGKIALARYYGGYRGGKSLEAEARGVAAILVYSDPIDDGWFQGPVYPAGPWGPASHVQRGGDVYDFLIPGDPLTPGWASTAGARRIAESESRILPKIPMLPLSARDAAELLRRMKGSAVPEGWQGLAWTDTYRAGPGPVRVRMSVRNTRERRPIRNVLGILRGTDEPERRILLSNHHDAWVYGAVDPGSGTAVMIALARAFGRLAREGWRPRRTLVFASWDAEEYTLTGSTEWGEEHESELARDAVVCINVDEATHGKNFSPSASPLLFEAIRDAARDVPDPDTPGKPLADSWRENAGYIGVGSYATAAGAREELPVAVLGSGSDYTVFFNRIGVASADLVFDGPYGVYHSVYDTFRWMETVGDPGFRYHAGMARYAGILALRFANADLLPFDGVAYGREIAGYAEELARTPEGERIRPELDRLAARARAWSRTSGAAQSLLAARLAAGELAAADRDAGNRWLLSLERALLDAEGLPGRPWFRHLVYAPLPSYAAETLPAIREALVRRDLDAARRAASNLEAKLSAGSASASQAARAVPRGGKPRAGGPAPEGFAGRITDAECGPDHGPMIRKGGMGSTDAECTAACARLGVPYGFLEEGTGRFYQLDDPEKPAPFAGRRVRILGRKEGDSILVQAIEPLP